MKLLTQLKDLKFVTILLLVFKKIGSKDKKKRKKYDNFYSSSKAEIFFKNLTSIMCLNQSILQL